MAGIYRHIPFCKQKCHYCNFHFSTSVKSKASVLEAMHRELEMQRGYLEGLPVETIYFGGGTPSILTPDEIKSLFDTIYGHYNVQLRECTLEANPDDLQTGFIKSLRDTPVNRFSIGVQSFHEADLRYMNRAHTAGQADYAIKAAQDAGFPNLTIDLIYGTPGLSDTGWKENLRKVRDLEIPHLSAYALTVEEGTALHHAIHRKKTQEVDAAQSARQFQILMEQAEAMGYEHYEISNFSLPGSYAIHNTNYWKGIPYLGIGPSAHSFNGRSRQWNVANNALYAQQLIGLNQLPFEEEILTPEQRLNEYLMTSLRTIWGCDLNKIAAEFGTDYRTAIEKSSEVYRERTWVEAKDDRLILTPAGKLFADRIAGDLFV